MKVTLFLLMAVGLASATDFTGVVTDSMCGKDHSAMKMTDEKKCVDACVKAGAKYALVDGGTVYTLSDQKAAAKFSGQKVTVSGSADKVRHTITVTKIVAQK